MIPVNAGHVRSKAHQHPRRVPHYMGISQQVFAPFCAALPRMSFPDFREVADHPDGTLIRVFPRAPFLNGPRLRLSLVVVGRQ
jgi:hypothetical protein